MDIYGANNERQIIRQIKKFHAPRGHSPEKNCKKKKKS